MGVLITEQHLFHFLLQIFLLLGAARLLGEVFTRWGLPALSAEMLVGFFFGPTILGRFSPEIFTFIFPTNPTNITMFETIAWLGAFFFLLQVGLEIDFSSAWRHRGSALVIAIMDTILPMSVGILFAWGLACFYPASITFSWPYALFLGAVITTSALPVAARALVDLKLSKTDLGFLILSALSVNDILGWMLFSLTFTLILNYQTGLMNIFISMALMSIFVFACIVYGRQFSDKIIGKFRKWQFPEPAASLTYLFLLGVLFGAIIQRIGLHPLLGFFLAGIVAGESKLLSENSKATLVQIVHALFVPIFFAFISIRVDFFKDVDLLLTLVFFIISVGIKFLGAWAAGALVGISRTNRAMVAIAHTPGGMMEIIMGLLALERGIINEKIFVAIVLVGLLSALLLGPWLTWVINRKRREGLTAYLKPTCLIPEINAHTRHHAMMLLAKMAIGAYPSLKLKDVIHAAVERELKMGTALGNALAIPHARIKNLEQPLIIFARSREGIDWDAPDGKKANYLFFLLTPQDDQEIHVQLLRSIATLMSDSAFTAQLNEAKDEHHIWAIFNQYAKSPPFPTQ